MTDRLHGAAHGRRQRTTDVDDKLAALHQQLAEQVRALRSGADWRRWLDAAARFHTYSFRNVLLIQAQRPEATAVAGYETWKALGRQVSRGEPGIRILAPVLRRTGADPDDETAAPPAAVPAPRRVVGFRLAYVWDVSQTAGEPLVERPAPQQLAGDAPVGMWEGLAGLVTDRGFTLERGQCGTANGVTNFAARTVRIRSDIDDPQAVKTLAHEVGHLLLHDPATLEGVSTAGCRGVAEVEAESVAYLLAAAGGLDTGGYTFPYVAGWAGSVDAATPEAVVQATGERVLAATRAALTRLDLDERSVPGSHQRSLVGQGRSAAVRLSAEAAAGQLQLLETPVVDGERLLAANTAATDFYRAYLLASGGAGPRRYLAGRGLGHVLDRRSPWQIGYAPAEWTPLLDYLRAGGFADEELVAAGLVRPSRRGGLVDVFRDRVMIPVREDWGSTVGFIGRARPGSRHEVPRYLNTSETALYRKGELLFGLAEQRGVLLAAARPVLVEGPMDVLAVAACRDNGGISIPAVAPCGTALTLAHVELLSRTAARERGAVVAFDADEAGCRAAVRAHELLSQYGGPVWLAGLPAGDDPAALLARDGQTGLRAALADPARLVPLADLVVDERVERWSGSLQFVDGRVNALHSAARVVAALPPEQIARQIARIAERLAFDHLAVTEAVLEAAAAPRVTRPALSTDRGPRHHLPTDELAR
jgi:DNA primase